MTADIQAQEIVTVTVENDVAYKIVQDVELAHVGGGNSSAHF